MKDNLGKAFDVTRFDIGYIHVKEAKLKRLEGEELRKYIK